MLCFSRCPGKREVSPFQPSSPLGLLAASSGSPPLWWLEIVQSGAVGVLVVHEQTPRQPLVPCSGEALKPQSQHRTCWLQAALIPCKRHLLLSWSSQPNPSAREEKPDPNPERRNPGSSVGVRKLFVENKILLALASALLLPIGGTGSFSQWSQPQLQLCKELQEQAQLLLGGVLLRMQSGSAERVPSSLPGPGLPSWCGWPRLRGCSAHSWAPEASRPAVLLLATASSNPLVGSPSLLRR